MVIRLGIGQINRHRLTRSEITTGQADLPTPMRERKSASEWLPHRTAAVVLRIGFRVQMVDAIRAWAKEAEKNILPQIGGTGVTNFDPAVKKDETLLGEGYITIQGESHSTEFRRIELLNLSACMDPKASNYKSYYAI